jgi:hypothetical protein
MNEVSKEVMDLAKQVLAEVLAIPEQKDEVIDARIKSLFDDDDDLNEPLGERCSLDGEECESCQ